MTTTIATITANRTAILEDIRNLSRHRDTRFREYTDRPITDWATDNPTACARRFQWSSLTGSFTAGSNTDGYTNSVSAPTELRITYPQTNDWTLEKAIDADMQAVVGFLANPATYPAALERFTMRSTELDYDEDGITVLIVAFDCSFSASAT